MSETIFAGDLMRLSMFRPARETLFGCEEWPAVDDSRRAGLAEDMWGMSPRPRPQVTRADLAVRVNGYVNLLPYVAETGDDWKPVRRTWVEGGDCEDLALVKYHEMRCWGVPAADLRLVCGRRHGEGHAMLVVRDGGWWALETALPIETNRITDFLPAWGMNEDGCFIYAR